MQTNSILIRLIYDDFCGRWIQTNNFPKNETFSLGVPFLSYNKEANTGDLFMCIEIEIELTLKQI